MTEFLIGQGFSKGTAEKIAQKYNYDQRRIESEYEQAQEKASTLRQIFTILVGGLGRPKSHSSEKGDTDKIKDGRMQRFRPRR